MKIKPKVKPQAKRDGSWGDDREAFMGLKPLRLSAFPESVKVTPISRRPLLSALAKMEGFRYTTFPLGNGQMVVLRYTLETKKGKKP